ncbi:glutathione synthase [Rhodomicrobium sp. Az07]|uniref:glutathione synthase n=1 Tax=Rhodomicrobium sp. Az07 TaxID=2839034 RepID=UPI001BEB5128|nr:glutathione synthase [Rhodomicrobium sp. Az07]MBT3071935.1 glutathione synthase [Rhodomicrobium sp. Az07]
MRLKTGVQMDPIEKIDIRGDSTFALLLEAQRRHHSIFYYTPDKLVLRDGRAIAEGHELRVHDIAGAHFELGPRQKLALDELDVIHLRQDPPFDMAYITTTHILDSVHPKTLVVNDPTSVRNAPEKLFVTQFPDLMPPTLIARTLDDVTAFREEFGDIIVKPLYGNGGAAVFRIKQDDTNTGSLVELFQTVFREPFVVQRYLPDVRAGDKRIILVDGEPVGAINRVPAANETRSNMHVGGRPEAAELTPRERDICAAIGPELKKRGLIFVGIDVIGDYLTEINVTSPTGIREVRRFGGADIAALIWDVVEEKVCSAKVP